MTRKDAAERTRGRAGRDPLREYRAKRDFRRTGEPAGSRRTSGTGSRTSGTSGRRSAGKQAPGAARHDGGPRFVVQRHEASTTHYDLRLEAAGVLKSWSVPKGPSADPRDKRLAMPTEDHPLEYASFEGEIPEGEYGAGKVTITDSGRYENLTTDRSGNEVAVPEAIERGHVTVRMHGEKLAGGYSLTRMGGSGRERWLLVKTADGTGG